MSSSVSSASSQQLFVHGNPTLGHVMTCVDNTGRARWAPVTATPGPPGPGNVYEWSIYLVDKTEQPLPYSPAEISTFNQALTANSYLKDTYTTITAAVNAAEADYTNADPAASRNIKRVVLIRPGEYDNETVSTTNGRVDLYGAAAPVPSGPKNKSVVKITERCEFLSSGAGPFEVTVKNIDFLGGLDIYDNFVFLADSCQFGLSLFLRGATSTKISAKNCLFYNQTETIQTQNGATFTPDYQIFLDSCYVIGNITLGDVGYQIGLANITIQNSTYENGVISFAGTPDAVVTIIMEFNKVRNLNFNISAMNTFRLEIHSCAWEWFNTNATDFLQTSTALQSNVVHISDTYFFNQSADPIFFFLTSTQLKCSNCTFGGSSLQGLFIAAINETTTVEFVNVYLNTGDLYFQTNSLFMSNCTWNSLLPGTSLFTLIPYSSPATHRLEISGCQFDSTLQIGQLTGGTWEQAKLINNLLSAVLVLSPCIQFQMYTCTLPYVKFKQADNITPITIGALCWIDNCNFIDEAENSNVFNNYAELYINNSTFRNQTEIFNAESARDFGQTVTVSRCFFSAYLILGSDVENTSGRSYTLNDNLFASHFNGIVTIATKVQVYYGSMNLDSFVFAFNRFNMPTDDYAIEFTGTPPGGPYKNCDFFSNTSLTNAALILTNLQGFDTGSCQTDEKNTGNAFADVPVLLTLKYGSFF